MPRPGPVVALAALCGCWAQPSLSSGPGEPVIAPVLHVSWVDATGCARGLEPVALAEVERLLRSGGVGLRWRVDSDPARAISDAVRVVVLGRARVASGWVVLGASPALRRSGPVAWVHLPSVQRGLGRHEECQRWRFDQSERRTLGIALGRVAIHEIVHALAPDVPHGRGLMSTRLHRDLLICPALGLDREVALAVRGALAAGRGLEPAMVSLEAGAAEALARGPE